MPHKQPSQARSEANIAFLVLAHGNWKHLERLCASLNAPGCRTFIHIDKKARLPDDFAPPLGASIIRTVRVYWAGFSIVAATLALMRQAIAETDADYLVLISGVDYPIRPVAELRRYLACSQADHINLWLSGNPHMPISRYGRWHLEFERRNRGHPLVRVMRSIESLSSRLPRKAPGFDIHSGQQWFALRRHTVGRILSVVDHDKRYTRAFRHTYCPDEAFFHSIIGNLCRTGHEITLLPALTYTDWSGEQKPAYISERHVELLKHSPHRTGDLGREDFFFARKFHDGLAQVVDAIDATLLRDPG